MSSSPAERFPFGLTLATGIALAILIALGVWQLQRLAWKQDLIGRLDALAAAPAEPVDRVLGRLSAGADVNFTRVVATCPGLAEAPFVELYAMREGQAGSRLISACAVSAGGYRTLLVDRGFVIDTVSARPSVSSGAGAPLRVTGVLRAPDPASRFAPPNTPSRFFTRDPAAMAAALGVTAPAPMYLMAETVITPGFPALTAAPVPTELANRHLEYALTWFGLAAALVGVYAALLLRRRAR
jgi:surfeit locus 1 family protein